MLDSSSRRPRGAALGLTTAVLVSALLPVRAGQVGTPAAAMPYTVAFSSFAPLDTDVFVAGSDGLDARPLFPHAALDYNAVLSPDEQWIVFTSTREGSADLYRGQASGEGTLERLTSDPAFDDQAAVSPDGRTLAFVSSRSGQADIWLMDLGSGAVRNLTNHAAGDFRPSWSPDGQWIAFSSDRDSKGPKFNFVTLHSTEIYVMRADGSAVRRVTNLDAFAGSPVWSVDGGRLYYYEMTLDDVNNVTSPRRLRGTSQIVAVDLATGAREILTNGSGEKWSPHVTTAGRVRYVSGGPEGGLESINGQPGARGDFRNPDWSQDGRRLVFHREVGQGWPPFETWPTRDSRFQLVRTGVFPAYHPSGRLLAMNDQTAGNLQNRILVRNSDGSGQVVLFGDPERSALAPVWSPDGTRVAFGLGGFFQAVRGAATADIALVNADGSGLRLLTDGSGNFGLPHWSPDGRQIVYRGAGGTRNGIYVRELDTGAVRRLTQGTWNDNFPAWSPAGDRILFTSNRDGDYDIYTMRPDGAGVQRLTSAPGNDAHAAWSPDGVWIVFTSARGGFNDEAPLHRYNPQPTGDLYVMRADGSDLRRLTDDQFEDGTPTFAPDGSARTVHHEAPIGPDHRRDANASRVASVRLLPRP